MENEKVICVDCQEEFEITEGWKKLKDEHPEVEMPKRCYQCRQKRKAEKRREENFKSRW